MFPPQVDEPPSRRGSSLIAQFALRLLLGMSLTWAVLPRRDITSGFFRIQLLLALALAVLAAVTSEGFSPPAASSAGVEGRASPAAMSTGIVAGGCAALAVAAFLGSVAWTLERRAGGTAFLGAILLGSAALLSAAAASRATEPEAIAFHVFSELASAAVLGSCVTGMLLGHWYLTAPTMSIAPLGRANLWFALTVLSRLIAAGVGLWLDRGQVVGPTHGVWLTLRWAAGLVLPLVLCAMVWRILRYRNTQAATGVLFAGVILVFLGELAGTLLSREVAWPL